MNSISLRRPLKPLGAVAACLLVAFNFSAPMRALHALPESARSGSLHLNDDAVRACGFFTAGESLPVSGQTDERLNAAADRITYRLFGVFPIKSVKLISGEEIYLMPGGTAVGIAIHTEGVLVVGLGTVDTEFGAQSPGAAAGLMAGDVILSVNGTEVSGSAKLAGLCTSGNTTLRMDVLRDGRTIQLTAMPVTARDGVSKLGIWVRDSTAGVGTISFFDAVSKRFAALGHPVSDVDTHSLLSIREGKVLPSEIVSVIQGTEGTPGELTGAFSTSGDPIGTIEKNTEYGIFGRLNRNYENGLCKEVALSEPSEAHVGGAVLLATVSENGVESFQCEITRISAQSEAAPKGMVIEVTDERLISKTGGIVQGMSGSPVLQDGRLVGVVTHVFVNDPLRGYCVYAKWMFHQMNGY